MGKKTDLARGGGQGGYHAPEINADTHNLFEEVPSLGIAADVMSLCDEAIEPTPNFRVIKPDNSVFNENLVGRIFPIGTRRPEIKQRLAGLGITAIHFPEYAPNTRFNVQYMQMISDIVGKWTTFRNDKMCFPRLTAAGGEAQIIITRPTTEESHLNWSTRPVQATSSSDSSTAIVGANFMFGFQTYKEPGDGNTPSQQHAKWCCIEPLNEQWAIPAPWIDNRNNRRNMPEGIGTERFRSLSKRQDCAMHGILRRMIKTMR